MDPTAPSGTPTTSEEFAIRLPYPKDSGAFPIRQGDVIMTRSMYDFIKTTLFIMPGMTPTELRRVCKQMSHDMEELLK